ncbi:MAG: GNAT family N-acetyltransferase [Geminicoccaceae bacterium]|nr:MAG: GNAT family N-acetyltransferase [Geminicoccaceae bacterium]
MAYRRPLLPGGMVAPTRLQGKGFVLRPLTIHDVVKDYDAVMSSVDRLVGHMDPVSDWPRGLSLEANLVDLAWHQREFTMGHSFAYTVVRPDDARCLGCAYVYPSDRAGYAAMAFWWVRTSEAETGLDDRLGRAFRQWLEADWPLRPIAFPGRDIGWDRWRTLPAI